jgi:hypothetical protein
MSLEVPMRASGRSLQMPDRIDRAGCCHARLIEYCQLMAAKLRSPLL